MKEQRREKGSSKVCLARKKSRRIHTEPLLWVTLTTGTRWRDEEREFLFIFGTA